MVQTVSVFVVEADELEALLGVDVPLKPDEQFELDMLLEVGVLLVELAIPKLIFCPG